jgi:hypothetical protein
MANHPSDADVKLVPTAEPTEAIYERDFYTWSQEQAEHVRAGRWTAVDRENVAEEIESLGREQFAKMRSAIRVLLIHMLKWDHQPDRRGRSWALSIKAQRLDLADILEGNPGVRPRIDEAISKAYRQAVLEAARETGLEEDEFPPQCPYGWDDITARDFIWS